MDRRAFLGLAVLAVAMRPDSEAFSQFLRLAFLRSPNYAAGSAGWTINQDGSAEFNNVIARGSVDVGPSNGSQVLIDTSLNYTVTTSMFATGSAAADVTSFSNITAAIRFPSNNASETSPPLIAQTLVTYSDGSVADGLLILSGFYSGGGQGYFDLLVSVSSTGSKNTAHIVGEYQVSGSTITLKPGAYISNTGDFVTYPNTGSVSPASPSNNNLIPAIENWHLMSALGYQNSWNDSGSNVAGKYRLTVGPPVSVEIIGDLTVGTVTDNTVIVTLPAAYRPLTSQIVQVTCPSGTPTNPGNMRLFVSAGGAVECESMAGLASPNRIWFHGFIALTA